jgi:hypothetical protein
MSKIKFITNYKYALEHFPPVPIKKVVPNWYKNLSRFQVDKELAFDARFIMDNGYEAIPQTAKGCMPMRDYMMSGYIIRTQSDILMKQEGNTSDNNVTSWSWFASNPNLLSVGGHRFEQLPVPLNGNKNFYIKFKTPWAIQTPPGYSCMFYQPEMFFETRFKLLPAIVDTDRYNLPVNFPGYITTTDDSFMIEAGTPLIAVFPFKRDKWEMETSFVKEDPTVPLFLINWYKKLFHSRKSYD